MGSKFAIVQHIERIPFSVMLLFYTYGDDFFNSKFPGTIIFLTLELSPGLNVHSKRKQIQTSCSQMTDLVENYLSDLYLSSVHEDQLKPLFTRIANNIILINEEKS